MVLDMTKLYGMIPIWITLTFSQGHRVKENYVLCNHSAVKLPAALQMIVFVD